MNKPVKLNGEARESPLYRFFNGNDAARNFLSGNIWFGRLTKYAAFEKNIRQDMTDGKYGRYRTVDKYNNEITVSNLSLTETYALCTSKPNDSHHVEQLRNRFSDNQKTKNPKYIKIFDVATFTSIIALALSKSIYANDILEIKWHKIEYTKGEFRNENDRPKELYLRQKHKNFKCENERRLVVKLRLGIDKTSPFCLSDSDIIKIYAKDHGLSVKESEKWKNDPCFRRDYLDKLHYIDTLKVSCSENLQNCVELLG